MSDSLIWEDIGCKTTFF